MSTIVLCPGQGAQKVGMARDLAERFPAARAALQELDDALGFALSATMFEGPDEALLRTEVTQPAILAHSVAVRAVLGPSLGPVAAAMGHSLGEYSAYVVTGVLTPADAVRLVRRRGELMAAAGDARPGAMSAVLGLATASVAACCASSSRIGDVAVAANLNAPDQTVISGDPDAVVRAGEACKAAGAKRVMPLKVSGAFHSPLMAPAQAGLAAALATAALAEPLVPVIANASALPVRTAAEARTLLVDQLTAPVRFVESVQTAAALVPNARWIEIGPGSVLAGLVKKSIPGVSVTSLGTADDVEAFLAA